MFRDNSRSQSVSRIRTEFHRDSPCYGREYGVPDYRSSSVEIRTTTPVRGAGGYYPRTTKRVLTIRTEHSNDRVPVLCRGYDATKSLLLEDNFSISCNKQGELQIHVPGKEAMHNTIKPFSWKLLHQLQSEESSCHRRLVLSSNQLFDKCFSWEFLRDQLRYQPKPAKPAFYSRFMKWFTEFRIGCDITLT